MLLPFTSASFPKLFYSEASCFLFSLNIQITFVKLPPPDIDGRVDMKLICGITVARRKGKPGKGGKVCQSKTHIQYPFGSIPSFDCNSWSICLNDLTCVINSLSCSCSSWMPFQSTRAFSVYLGKHFLNQ